MITLNQIQSIRRLVEQKRGGDRAGEARLMGGEDLEEQREKMICGRKGLPCGERRKRRGQEGGRKGES